MISSNNITSIIFCMVYYSTKVFSFFFHTCTIIRYIYLFHQVLQIYKFGNSWHEALFTKRIIIIRETHWRYKFIEKYCLFQFHYCYVVIMLNAWVIVLAIFMMYCYFCNIISFVLQEGSKQSSLSFEKPYNVIENYRNIKNKLQGQVEDGELFQLHY